MSLGEIVSITVEHPALSRHGFHGITKAGSRSALTRVGKTILPHQGNEISGLCACVLRKDIYGGDGLKRERRV